MRRPNITLKIEDIKNILIPIDGSDYSIHAAQLAISLAKVLGAAIHSIYIIDTIILDEISKAEEKNIIEKEFMEDGERYLKYITKLAEQNSVRVDSIILKGQPYDQIINFARAQEVNLIVMGTKGRRGTERILIGSVAERVIEYAPCPVLVVK